MIFGLEILVLNVVKNRIFRKSQIKLNLLYKTAFSIMFLLQNKPENK